MSNKVIQQCEAWFLEHVRPGSLVSIVAETQERAVELAAQLEEILKPHCATMSILTMDDFGVDFQQPDGLRLVTEKIRSWRQRCRADNEIAIFTRPKAEGGSILGSYIWTQEFDFALEETPNLEMYLHKALGIIRPSVFTSTC